MTNQGKFIQIFGIDIWQQMVVFSGLAEQFKEYWTSSYDDMAREPILDKIKAKIKEWYWQADKQALAKDPCVVDAMIDLFIRTIDKYKVESEE